jgi:hypothetical protein
MKESNLNLIISEVQLKLNVENDKDNFSLRIPKVQLKIELENW